MDDLTSYQARFIKRLLKETGLSQKEFADMVGVTNVTVSRWANGTSVISDYNVQKIHDAFPKYDFFEIVGLDAAVSAAALAKIEQLEAEKQLLFDAIALSFPGEIETLPAEEIKGSKRFALDKQKPDYKLSHDGKTLTLSGEQMEQFKDEISGYIEMRLNQMLERGCW